MPRLRMEELYLRSPTSLWRGAYLSKHRDNFTITDNLYDHVRKYLTYDKSYTVVSSNITLYEEESVNRSQLEAKQM
jgi:hypothetical protein